MSASPTRDPRVPGLPAALAEVEGLLRTARDAGAALGSEAARALAARRLGTALAALEAAAAADPRGAARLEGRLREVRALAALHLREVPAEAFEGLYEAIREGTREPWSRAGMSGAFLDAPAALGRWRAVATAACLLLAVGVGVWTQRDADGPLTTARELADPRDELLLRLDERDPATDRRALGPSGLERAGTAVPAAWDAGTRRRPTLFTFQAGVSQRFVEERALDAIERSIGVAPAVPRVVGATERN